MTFATDVATARAFVRPLTQGFNIERGWAWSIPGGTAAHAAYLVSIGATHVRLFYPFRPSAQMNGPGSEYPPSKTQFARILDAAAIYMAAGMKVLLACTDVITAWEDLALTGGEARIDTHLQNCATWIAERAFDPTKIAISPWNELGGDDDYTAQQLRWFGYLRAALPGYVLSAGSIYWNDWTRLVDRAPFINDGLTLWPVHIYERHTKAGWDTIATSIETWRAAHGGLVVTLDEVSPAARNEDTQPSLWPDSMTAVSQGMGQYRPCYWTITYGSSNELNVSGSDATLKPAVQAAFVSATSALAASLALSDPAPQAPAPPDSSAAPQAVAMPPLLPVPDVPDLGGPFGTNATQTDTQVVIHHRKALVWVLGAVQALLGTAQQLSDYLQSADAVNAAQAHNENVALHALLTSNLAAQAQQQSSALTSAVSTLNGSLAPKASPTFTGTVTVPTPNAGTNNTQAASTAFVQSAVASATSGLASASSLGSYATTGALSSEASSRQSGDTNLQNQINTINSRLSAAGIA